MRSPLMSRLLGESTGDVVPVIANMPRKTYRDRMTQKRTPDKDPEEPDAATDSVQRMVGEARREEKIIPDDAQPIDSTEMTVGKPLREPKEIVQEPSHPPGEKEKFQTPYAALTAPDVTPQSTQPIDPSEVPGNTTPERFTASELERAQPEPSGLGGEDTAVKAMDVLLGRTRAAKPPTQPGEFEQAGAIKTEEEAAAALGIKTPLQEEAAAKAASVLVAAAAGGAGMPPPPPSSDGAAVYSAFRKFNG